MFSSAQPRITSPIYRFNLVLQDCLWARWFATWWFFEPSSNTHTRGHRYKLTKNILALVWEPPFCNRVISVWNYLPPAAVDFSSISRLKRDTISVDLLSSRNRFSTMFILLSVCVCVHVCVYSFILHFLFALFLFICNCTFLQLCTVLSLCTCVY